MNRIWAISTWLVLALVSPVSAQLVERVIDGDTVVVAGIGTIRLIGVDTPETVDPRQPVQEFGREARAFLQGLIGGKTVRLEFDQQRRDKYGRTLAYLKLADNTFVNAEIVRQGYGHAYAEFPFQYLEAFRRFENEARAAKRGLWSSTTGPASTALAKPVMAGDADMVYVTRTGEKYHRAGCRFLARSQIPMPLAEASARYGACSVCTPPTSATAQPMTVTTEPRAPTPPPSVSGRCQATTQRGTQCSRQAQAGSSYCWQHGR
jgi:micrococcal nuclease